MICTVIVQWLCRIAGLALDDRRQLRMARDVAAAESGRMSPCDVH